MTITLATMADYEGILALHKTYHTVGHDEVGIITPACRELVTEGLFIGHKLHGAFHAIVV